MSFPIRVVTRVTVELLGPCSIGAGETSSISDMPFVVDASGLPALPGSSLAGLLRANMSAQSGEAKTEYWFGSTQSGDGPTASRVNITWGRVHNMDDQPVDRRLREDDRDDLLSAIAGGEVRDHVRITHRGVADAEGAGKFDRQVLFTGTRFSFELEIYADEYERDDAQAICQQLVEILDSPATRLGGGTRSGLGAFKVVRAKSRAFNLFDGGDFKDYLELSRALDIEPDFPDLSWEKRSFYRDLARIDIKLTPETFFLIGGGEEIEGASDEEGPKIAPVTTRIIKWTGGLGRIEEKEALYIPGSAIKGALSHRIAFHANRLLGNFAEDLDDFEAVAGESNPVIRKLFGFSLDDRGGDESLENDSKQPRGSVGRLIFDEVYIGYRGKKRMVHISTDPFTGGVRQGFLFTEEAIAPGGAPIEFSILVERPEELNDLEKRALKAALEDLTTGRLAIGSGESRGNGRFQGEFQWPRSLDTKSEAKAPEVMA